MVIIEDGPAPLYGIECYQEDPPREKPAGQAE
jgi:hypothetical protein